MKAPSITIDRKLKTVTIVMSLETARPSKATGRTMVIASTRGLRTSDEQYARKPVLFTANAFFYPANSVNSDSSSADSNGTNDDPPRATGSGRKVLGLHTKVKKEES
jgi:hypothetical protein